MKWNVILKDAKTVNNALEATIARQNSHAFTEQEPHLDGVSRTLEMGAAHSIAFA